ncbi:hypothetical protein [Dermabacter jinjuensis]|uniref:hypothetical protein n=1 Tax=Dermabacter jinjuensis TaxID=1667168 RepID=UPI0013747E66|nr:hypothetical protein [Dermabacter jinjuensis]
MKRTIRWLYDNYFLAQVSRETWLGLAWNLLLRGLVSWGVLGQQLATVPRETRDVEMLTLLAPAGRFQ